MMKRPTIYRMLYLSGIALAAWIPVIAIAQSRNELAYPTLVMPVQTPQALPPPVVPDKRSLGSVDVKLHAQLRVALDARAQGSDWALASGLPSALRRGDQVLVEVHFPSRQPLDEARTLLSRHGATLRNSLSQALHEAWVPVERLRELASDAAVLRIAPARLARHLATTSQGVAAGNADFWQKFNPGYTGTGITIAMIDGYNNVSNQIGSLQGSGDWPAAARLTKIDLKTFPPSPPADPPPSTCAVETFGCAGDSHGNATMELVYDVAPGATYRAYDTLTVGDWYNAILDAANVGANGNSLGGVKANVISASLAAPLDGIGDGSAQAGSIAEAAGFARDRGVLVVNAAGNERQQHWGGLYSAATSNTIYHSWSGPNTIYNFFGSNGSAFCIPPNTVINLDMYWNDWTLSGADYVADQDYDLYLFHASDANTWDQFAVAQSNNLQNGALGAVPQESISFTTASGVTTTGCSSGAVYGVAVVRVLTSAVDNLQVFSNIQLNYSVAARSLDFPADSAKVLSVAAIDVGNATSNPQEPFSSEGPVLAAGGDLPSGTAAADSNLKPDLASFDHVSTVTAGNVQSGSSCSTAGNHGFCGTSAATPHAAGMAALFMQRFGIQTSAANLLSKIVTPLRTIAATGSNDLGAVGKDYQYGYGRLRFQKDTALAFIQQPTNTLVNSTIAPPIKIGIYDAETKLDPYTLFDTLTLAIANDPSGGTAVLSGGGAGTLASGIATYSAAKINLGGVGYTLQATATAASTPPINLSVASNAFNITTGVAAKLAFTVPPSPEVAGHTISPSVTIAVEDSNNNIVNTDNTTSIKLTRTSCSGVVPVGGGPITVTNGVASFPNLTLFTVGSATLTASASGRTPITSGTFAISANTDLLFHGGFETCVP